MTDTHIENTLTQISFSTVGVSLTAVLLFGGAFGFFYAWVCSTMWGLDAVSPDVAIEAMQAMNASVRNAVFFPVFFLTPVVAAVAAYALYASGHQTAAAYFLAAAVVYLLGGMALTMIVQIPMNEALAAVTIPENTEDAQMIWAAYSAKWQVWNITRTVFSGLALLLASIGLTYFVRG